MKRTFSINLKLPLPGGANVGLSNEVNTVLSSLEASDVANIHNYSIGNDKANLQMETVDNISILREKLQGFIKKQEKPVENETKKEDSSKTENDKKSEQKNADKVEKKMKRKMKIKNLNHQ